MITSVLLFGEKFSGWSGMYVWNITGMQREEENLYARYMTVQSRCEESRCQGGWIFGRYPSGSAVKVTVSRCIKLHDCHTLHFTRSYPSFCAYLR